MLGMMHRVGKGGPQDFAEARRLLALAVEHGDDAALTMLGNMLHEGKGGPKDHAEAARLFGLTAKQGDAEA